MSALTHLLVDKGIAQVESPFSSAFLAELNAAIDGVFKYRQDEARAYVHYDDLARLGLLQPMLTGRMRDLLTAIVPDPVLYHCHVYEIAGNNSSSHIFGETLGGWHKDPDSEFDGSTATHVSIFLYLSDVGPEDGPFEFCPQLPDKWLRNSSPAITVTGDRNYCFAWNRAFFHRAAPNRGPKRRRLLKLSIQPNRFPNMHMPSERFEAVRQMLPEGDPYIDILLGRYLGRAAPETERASVEAIAVAPTGALGIPDATILKTIARDKARAARRWLKGQATESAIVTYD